MGGSVEKTEDEHQKSEDCEIEDHFEVNSVLAMDEQSVSGDVMRTTEGISNAEARGKIRLHVTDKLTIGSVIDDGVTMGVCLVENGVCNPKREEDGLLGEQLVCNYRANEEESN